MNFTFYTSTQEAWRGMAQAFKAAQRTIHIEQYIFNTDDAGMEFIGILREKAKNGVKVKILADAVGSSQLFLSPLVKEMQKDGIEIRFFNTFIIGAPGHHTTLFFRDHSKLAVIDRHIGFTGGICIKEMMRDWRDTHVQIEGGAVIGEMEEAFERMWHFAQKKILHRAKKRTLEDTEYITSAPIPTQRYMYYRLIEAIRNAKQTIHLTTPYFAPDRRLFRVLLLAARRGVDVALLLPKSSDYWYMDLVAESYFNRALRSGIRIYLYTDSMIHAKTGIIDGEWATVGSQNLDTVSLRYNFEANIVSSNKDFVRVVESHFLEDISKAQLLRTEMWKKRPQIRKLLNILVKPFRIIL